MAEMRYIFDLDGTLLDSYDAVHQAYFKAGVNMPIDAWGKPYRDWLPAVCKAQGLDLVEVRAKKNIFYADFIHLVKRTPLLNTLMARGLNPIEFITGASITAVDVAYRHKILPSQCVARAVRMDATQKRGWILQNVRTGPVTYVDDDPDARRIVAQCQAIHVISPDEAMDIFV